MTNNLGLSLNELETMAARYLPTDSDPLFSVRGGHARTQATLAFYRAFLSRESMMKDATVEKISPVIVPYTSIAILRGVQYF
jgi:hypothetical protein